MKYFPAGKAWAGPMAALLCVGLATAQPEPILTLEGLCDPALDPAVREAGLARLRDQAGGVPTAPETREAMFLLARYRQARPDETGPRQVIAELTAAAGLYPDDPRTLDLLPFLAELQLGIGDVYGAHIAFKHEYRLRQSWPDADRAALAAHTAARALDMRTALGWSDPLLLADMSDEARADLYLARLKAAAALGRVDIALRSANALELHASDTLHTDGDAVTTAALLYASTAGKDEAAARLLSVSANVHPGHERHPEVLHQLARHHRLAGRDALANETYNQLIYQHPESRQAWLARIEQLTPDGRPLHPIDIRTYLDAARSAPDPSLIATLCDTLFNKLLASGYPLEAFMATATLAREGSLSAMVARRRADADLDAALELLIARRSTIAVASISQVASELELSIPEQHFDSVNAARKQLGLEPVYGAPYDSALREANALFREKQYDQAITQIRPVLGPRHRRDQKPAGWRVSIGRIYAEALWQENRSDEALEHLEFLLGGIADGTPRRELLLLHADLLFPVDRERSCALYTTLAAGADSPWVSQQRKRCERAAAKPDEEEAS